MRFSLASVAMILLACVAGCRNRPGNSGTTVVNQVSHDRCEAGPPLRVGRAADYQRAIGDRKWPKWTSDLRVLTLNSRHEWPKIRDYLPTTTVVNDFEMTVDMSHDDAYWYVRMDVTDEQNVMAPPNYPPHSGDCLELFFAGTGVDSSRDMQELINRSQSQRAFFQLQVFYRSGRLRAEVSPYRTDDGLRSLVQDPGFRINASKVRDRWLVEVSIPFKAFDDGVKRDIQKGLTRIGIDYLDYDEMIKGPPQPPSVKNHYGFEPHNVFAVDPEERNVNVPKCMRPLIFEQ